MDNIPYPAFLRLSKSDILSKYQDLEWEKNMRLSQQWDATSQWARDCDEVAQGRNRYNNVFPYATKRIKLNVPEGHNDYINASPIELHSTKSQVVTKFIATQGPEAHYVSHIWRMLWHEVESPAVVVMVTQTHEMNREKCYAYYPLSLSSPTLIVNDHDEFNDGFMLTITLTAIHEDQSARCTVRELNVRHAEGEEKVVIHLQFGGWPDFAVPEGPDRAALVKLVELSNVKNAEHPEAPRVVHCSAGVGRSGTFIALDWLLRELSDGSLDDLNDDDDPINDVVARLRDQRMWMVQSPMQFQFLYDVVRREWRQRWMVEHPGDVVGGEEAAPHHEVQIEFSPELLRDGAVFDA